jgi:lipopolysaccharide export system permease protein
MPLPWTLAKYLATQFITAVATVLVGFLAIVFLFDLVAEWQRFGPHNVGFPAMVTMSLLKMPNLIEETIPFATLAGATWAFSRLSRSSELIVARAAGISAWQFLSPAILISLVGGVFLILAYDPLAAAMMERYDGLQAKYLHNQQSLLDVSASGLWLRQMDGGVASIINAEKVSEQGAHLETVAIYMFSPKDKFLGLVTAKVANLEKGHWLLEGGEIRRIGSENRPEPIAEFGTTLTPSQIQDSFANPKSMSFWQLPHFIHLAQIAGFNALRHRLHFYSMLATPLLLCAMVLVSAVFALRVQRGRGLALLVVGAVTAGFGLYVSYSICKALGLSGVVPVTLAAWAPSATATLLGVAFLLHFEDG